MLYFVAHGSYQKCVGNNFNLAIEQPTVSNVLAETTDIMVAHFKDQFIRFPQTLEERDVIKQQ